MNGFTKRTAGLLAAGLLTMAGVAMSAPPSYAAGATGISVSDWEKGCKDTHGDTGQAVANGKVIGVGCTWNNGDGTRTDTQCDVNNGVTDPSSCVYVKHPAHKTTPVRKLTIRNNGIVIVTTSGTRVSIKTSPATGITTIKTPGSKPVPVVPPSAVTGPGSPVVKPVTPVTQPTPTPTSPTRPSTGIVTKPGGAIG